MRFLKTRKVKLSIIILLPALLSGYIFIWAATGEKPLKIVASELSEFDRKSQVARQTMTMLQQEQADIIYLEEPEDGAVLPDGLEMRLKYTKHLLPYQYVIAKKANVHIKDAPLESSKALKETGLYERFEYIETVQSSTDNTRWAHISWQESGDRKFGFISSNMVRVRSFTFDKMFDSVLRLERECSKSKISYINNYKDMTGKAPAYHGGDQDRFGNRRSQSAPGYESSSESAEFQYICDGSLVKILSSKGDFYHVKVLTTGVTCWVPQKYVPAWKKIESFSKAIVIDVTNQNEALFEKTKEGWRIVSYTLATTGAKAKYKFETPPGYYFAIEKREKFDYLDDVTLKVAGYAPYALRFTGGAYIHGIPVSYKFENGKRIDPGKLEESKTLGTIPLSHQCVRNYTSHAQFIKDWAEIGKTAVIVVE